MESGILSLPRKLDIWNTDTVFLTQVPPATPNYGIVNLGGSAFDGVALARFIGAAGGTVLAINAPSGFTGSLIDAQLAGGSKFKVDYLGQVSIDCSTSSTGSPTTFGMTNLGSGNAARWQFGSVSVGIQLAQASDIQIYNYWGIQLVGGRQISGSGPTFSQLTNVGTMVINTVTTSTAFAVKGVASQSADLQQWQDSSGNVLGQFTAGGQIRAVRSGTPSQYVYMYHDGVGHVRCVGSLVTFDDGIASGVVIGSTGSGPGSVVATIKGATSQSVDLQQWQSSTSTVLAKVSNTGAIDDSTGIGAGTRLDNFYSFT